METSTSLALWPDVMHLAVLRFLGGKSEVAGFLKPYRELCRACLSASCNPVLWHEIDLSTYSSESHLDSTCVLAMLARCGSGTVERLSLRGLEAVDDALVCGLAAVPSCSGLRVLDLGTCPNMSGESLPALEQLTKLEEISLECMAGLEDAHVLELCCRKPRLHSLDVRHCEKLTDASSLLLRPEQDAWTALHLDGCFRFNIGQLLTDGAFMLSKLMHLSLDGEDLDGQYFNCLAKTCPELRSLAISFARDLEPAALCEMAGLARLESLTLKKASQPKDVEWAGFFTSHRAVSSSCKAAERSAAQEGGPPQMAQDIPGSWTLLSFAECEFFADKAICTLAVVQQPALLEIDLSWCWHLTDKGLSSILLASPNLQRVKLAGSKGLTGVGLVPCIRLHRLEELDCTSCNSVPDGILEFLHRLFAGRPGSCDEALPKVQSLPPLVAEVAAKLWTARFYAQRRARLQIKNYYAEYLENWSQLRPSREVCEEVEALLQAHSLP
mmetsp:Transcript_6033/g.13305  ORF Transcript_6033/g.13305 Transcript_6033/m.13305 type:complete len:498 (-) Transcript_6033:43-1536(-)